MRPGLEEMFKEETAELLDNRSSYGVRIMKWSRLIQLQEGCVREDGTIASPINPEDVKDSKEYLERLKQITIPL